jgi:hypothetical protein
MIDRKMRFKNFREYVSGVDGEPFVSRGLERCCLSCIGRNFGIAFCRKSQIKYLKLIA